MRTVLPLDFAYYWEEETPDRLWLTQPLGGGAVKTYTWAEGMDEARRMAAHLRSLGFPEKSHIAVWSKNTAWWVLADLAIWMAGHVSVPLYATLPPDAVHYVLEHSDSRLVFIGKLDGFQAMAIGIPDGLARIEMPLGPGTDAPKWADIVARTEPLEGEVWRDPDEMATISYTSGSTAQPKGVMISFGAMAAAGRGIRDLLGVNSRDRMLSYLPLSHAFERWIGEIGSLMSGYALWYAESQDTFIADLRRAQPTLFISVPRLWQKFQHGILQRMPAERLDRLLKVPLVGAWVRHRVLSGLGLQHVRFAGSGSAPIPAEVIAWYRRLGLELLEGYGMTEDFNYSHVSRPGEVRAGYVGRPYDDVEQRIGADDEILVKSPAVMMGYYKNPEATAAAFTEDGWLRTGDRGEIDEEGRLKITGRVKEIFKTSKAKYVSPAPIENELMLHPDVEMACVMGSGMPQPHAVVMLSEEARVRLGEPGGHEALARSLQDHLDRVNAALAHHEKLAFLAVVGEEWTVEDGLLTPTLKVKRRIVEERYEGYAPGWYEEATPVVWAGERREVPAAG